MHVAILLYPRFTTLDAVGPYEILSRLRGSTVTFVAERPGPVTADTGMLSLVAEAPISEVPHPDLVVVPGGPGQSDQMADGPVHEWLRAADRTSNWTASVCTGSLILAAAGLLAGRRATSHWLAMEPLAAYGAQAVSERVVIDGKYITGAGVSAGIDMALALAGQIDGREAAEAIQLMIEYAPEPPFQAGTPLTAPPELVARLRGGSRHTAAAAGQTAS
jgi:transcriptional regulator GlxA family with amidase domain